MTTLLAVPVSAPLLSWELVYQVIQVSFLILVLYLLTFEGKNRSIKIELCFVIMIDYLVLFTTDMEDPFFYN